MAPTHALIFVAALTLKKIALNYNELIPSNDSRGIIEMLVSRRRRRRCRRKD